MQFADNSVKRHIVKRALIGINVTQCGQYYRPSYDTKDYRADIKMPLCKTCKKLALAAIKKMDREGA